MLSYIVLKIVLNTNSQCDRRTGIQFQRYPLKASWICIPVPPATGLIINDCQSSCSVTTALGNQFRNLLRITTCGRVGGRAKNYIAQCLLLQENVISFSHNGCHWVAIIFLQIIIIANVFIKTTLSFYVILFLKKIWVCWISLLRALLYHPFK